MVGPSLSTPLELKNWRAVDTRIWNCLKRQGLTLADTATMTDRGLLRIPNFGLKSLGRLRLAEPAQRPVPEITLEMVEAGMDEFYGHPIVAFEPTIDEVREAIVATYRAMALACR